jgi:hypothetical protein
MMLTFRGWRFSCPSCRKHGLSVVKLGARFTAETQAILITNTFQPAPVSAFQQ